MDDAEIASHRPREQHVILEQDTEGRILVCDKDAVVRRVVREHLTQEGFEVAAFDSPEQCLASALADAPAGIVLGLKGSELELEYLGLLRAQGIDTPIVALVPGPATSTGVLAEQAGASGDPGLVRKGDARLARTGEDAPEVRGLFQEHPGRSRLRKSRL